MSQAADAAHADARARADRSAAWVGVASFVLGLLDLLSTLICLRWWVSTEELGAATLAAALFPILDRLGGMGLVSAVVRKPDTRPETLASIFWLGAAASGALCAALCVARPIVGAWFPDPIIASLLAGYGGKLVVQNLAVVPEGLMKRELRYRELSLIRIISSGLGTATLLGAAWLGAHGVPELRIWCFALGPITRTIVATIGVQLCHRWWPRLRFERAIAGRVARFTAAMSGSELLFLAYTSADYLVVGLVFGKAAVGAYRLAYELVLDVVRLVSLVTAEVAFPTFVRLARDPRAVGAQLLRFTRQNLIVLAPFVVFVAIEADDLLALLYPPLPPEAATAARILCVVGSLRTLGFVLPPLLAAVGQASRVLVYELVAVVVLPLGFVIAAETATASGFVAVAWAWAVGDPLAFAVLLAMALPAAAVRLVTYLRAIGRVVACALGAAVAGGAMRLALAGPLALRAGAVAVVVVASYGLLLAWLERITPAAIVRGFRAPPPA